jgi:catechol 2,3-dioxygenase-like lactoylglutathione lyase family enzyme
MLDSLDHVLIGVRHLDAATAAYTALLGLEPSWRGTHPEGGTANTLYRLDNTYVELIAPAGSGPEGDLLAAWLESRDDGLLAIAFGTSDAQTCHQGLAARGLEPAAVEDSRGVDTDTGAEREWRRVPVPIIRTRGVLLFAIEHRSPPDRLQRATPNGDPAAAVSALDHTVIRSSDAEAAAALYGEALGLRLALDRRFEDWGVRLQFFRVGAVTVEVASALESRGDDASEEDRLWGLSYRVPDADAARARLVAQGLDVSEVRPGRRPDTRVLTVRSGTCGVPTLMLELTDRRDRRRDEREQS